MKPEAFRTPDSVPHPAPAAAVPVRDGVQALLANGDGLIAEHPRIAAGVLFAVTAWVYRGVLTGLFNLDDVPLVLRNPYVTKAGNWKLLFLGSIWSFRGSVDTSAFYRPLQFIVYWILYRLAGPNPAAFHLLQLGAYASSVGVAFLLARELLGNDLAAFTGALLWALHPLHVEIVAWVSGLGDATAGLLVMLSFWLFLRGEKRHASRMSAHASAAAIYLAALLFKELALCLPLLVLAYWFYLGERESWLARLRRWMPYVIATGVYLGLRASALGLARTAPEVREDSRQTVAAAIGLLGQHAKLFLFPLHLSLARDFVLSASLRSPWPWLTLLALAGAFIRGRRQPLVGFGVAWWAIALLPCLDIRYLVGYLVADRFSYLPSVGLCLALAFGALVLLPRRLAGFKSLYVQVPVLLVVPALWMVQDLRNVPNWHDEDTVWSHAAAATPGSSLAHLYRGMHLEIDVGDLDGAAREYQAGLRSSQANLRRLATAPYGCDLGLGRIALKRGRMEEAVEDFEAAVRVNPRLAGAYRELGTLYFPQGDYARAADYFARAVQADPQDVLARFFLGTCWRKLGKPARAAEQFHAARQADPTYLEAYQAEAEALEAEGDHAAALRVRRQMPGR